MESWLRENSIGFSKLERAGHVREMFILDNNPDGDREIVNSIPVDGDGF